MSEIIPIPQEFINNSLDRLSPEQIFDFLSSLDSESPVSIRVNPYKLDVKPLLTPVPWSKYGFYLDKRPAFITDPFFHAGLYYVQEPASMFIEQIYTQLFGGAESLKILDLCAAPGGKSTHISTLAGLESLVVSNEVIRSRANILRENIVKWGLGNTIVTNNDPRDFGALSEYFDLIVADVPCSGEGMFRKTPETRNEWTPANVQLCASRQRRIISDIWGSLKQGGVLIYSTCTFNSIENEENIKWMTEEFDCEPVAVSTLPEWNIQTGMVCGHPVFRFYPHRTTSEGFFICAIRKAGEHREQSRKKNKSLKNFAIIPSEKIKNIGKWIRQPEYMVYYQNRSEIIYALYGHIYDSAIPVFENLNVIYSGVEIGKIYGQELKPSHALALFHDVSREGVIVTDIDLKQAVSFLRKQDLDPTLFQEGINLVTYRNIPTGWIKRINNRCNNLYPKEMRIMNPNIEINKDSFL
ncbi:MAG: rRNA cytosine-C5-methylase [Rikenellaceae bacterium]|nr:rRNA cytosine-C5-methylase [Rikenellaceae bacterium]